MARRRYLEDFASEMGSVSSPSARLFVAAIDVGRQHAPISSQSILAGHLSREYEDLFNSFTSTREDAAANSIQSCWRTFQKRQRLIRWKANRRRRLQLHFKAWKVVAVAQYSFQSMTCRRVWKQWCQMVSEEKRTRVIVWRVFQNRIGQKSLSLSAVNLFFSEKSEAPPDALCANALSYGELSI